MKILLAGGHILYAKMYSCSLTATYNINRPANWCVINMLPCNWNNKSHTLTWLKKLSLWWFAVIKINVLIMDVPKMHTSMSPNLQLVELIFQCEEIEWMTVCAGVGEPTLLLKNICHWWSHLRSAHKSAYDTPRICTTFGSKSFSFAAPYAWNQLPADIRAISTVSTFKQHLKTHLFKIAYCY